MNHFWFNSSHITLYCNGRLGRGVTVPPPLLKKTASTVPSQWFVSGRIVLQEWNIVVQSAEQNPMSANVSLLPLFLNSSLCNNYLYNLKKWLLLHPPFPPPPQKKWWATSKIYPLKKKLMQLSDSIIAPYLPIKACSFITAFQVRCAFHNFPTKETRILLGGLSFVMARLYVVSA